VDFIGFSHEYGRACIRPLDEWQDLRMIIVVAMLFCFVGVLLLLLHKQGRRSVFGVSLIVYTVNLSWMVTLFPISGIVKVGTFIADRIVVASTVPVCILVAFWLSSWVLRPRASVKGYAYWKLAVLSVVLMFMWRRVHLRTVDWMDSKTLLESSLETCPRFAKAHLETSKIYSGLYPQLLNLTKSRWHLEQVEAIDPDFCDVHQQFAIIAVQENNHREFEDRLVKSLLCPFTLGAVMPMWHNYWELTLPQGNSAMQAASRKRYEEYMTVINKAIQEDESNQQQEQSTSPLVGWRRKG
jgi:hypothetical protein